MELNQHRRSRRPTALGAAGSSYVSPRSESCARPYAKRLRSGSQADVPRLARLHGINERDVNRCRQRHVLGDIHALTPAPPRTHLCRSSAQRLGCVALALPSEEPEGGFEQGHRSEALLPAGFLSFRRARVLIGIWDGAGIGEYDSLNVLERNAQERRDAHHLMERGSSHATELPALDRAGTDADDLPESGARIARRLAAILQQSRKSCLLESHRCTRLTSVDQPPSQHIPSDLRDFILAVLPTYYSSYAAMVYCRRSTEEKAQ